MLSPKDVMPYFAGNPDSLFFQVADRLATAIISGEIAEGELIPNETSLFAGMPVSRSVHREALKYLSAKGLIEARPRSGTRAAPASKWSLLDPDVLRWSMAASGNEKFIRDLYELRGIIEPNAAALSALRRTDEQAAALRRAFVGMQNSTPYSEENARFDILFHEALLDACGNEAFLCLKSVVIATVMWSLRLFAGRIAPDYAEVLADHRRVCEAVERRNPARAQAVMNVLVQDAFDDTIAFFRARREGRLKPKQAE
jgi:GntR family galactonate operon transcriptional repressor